MASLSEEERKEIMDKAGLIYDEAVEVFEYGENNDEYWDEAKLHKQVVNKALLIAEAFYPGYSLFFFLIIPPVIWFMSKMYFKLGR